jgi:hypothetical protein
MRSIGRDLEAIYSNSNILFPHKDAEILFFSGFGFTFYGLRSKLGVSMYKLLLRDLSPFTGQLFHASKHFRMPLNAANGENSTPYSTDSLNLVIK